MTKKVKSTVDEFMDSMSSKEKKEFNEGLRDLVLSELIMALMDQDELSVRKLAKMVNL